MKADTLIRSTVALRLLLLEHELYFKYKRNVPHLQSLADLLLERCFECGERVIEPD